jgi:hypothetical protein
VIATGSTEDEALQKACEVVFNGIPMPTKVPNPWKPDGYGYRHESGWSIP